MGGGVMIRMKINLREEQANAIKQIAATQRLSMAEVVRRAVDRLLTSVSSCNWNERHHRALEIVGKFRSGKSSISSKHDRYLAEAYRK